MSTQSFTVTIPTAKAVEILDTITDYLNYQTEIDGEANPQSRKSYLNDKFLQWLRDNYEAGKATTAAQTARQTEIDAAQAITLTITD